MFKLKRKVKSLHEAFTAGLSNTGNVSATVNGKLVLSWHGTPTQKDDALKMFPVIKERMMPGEPLASFADAVIANIHDEGMAKDDVARNVQSIAMLWRLFTTPVDSNDPSFTYGDLVAVKNFHVALEVHEQPNGRFRVT
jgi:hypothetical protein